MISDTLQQPYDRSRWTTLIHEVFPNVTIYEKPESSSEKPEWIRDFFQLGNVRLQDGKNLAIFEIRVDDKVQLSRNRVTLRELISKKIDLGTTHGVLCVFNSSSPEYRFTFVAKEVGFDEEGAITTTETNSKRYTYVLGPGETRRTAAQRFTELAAHREGAGVKEVIEAFSVERLNKEFFRTYKEHYQAFVNHLINQTDLPRTVFGITEKPANSNYEVACKPIRDWVKQLLGRIVFIHFIQKKGWMGCKAGSKGWKDGDPQFLKNFFDSAEDKAKFCSQNLASLFFEALNLPDRPGDIFEPTRTKIPYLNGGLFDEPDEITRKIDFPENLFKSLLDFLAAYNFTIDENDPEEHEVGIDPEMLGHIFENLLEENKDKGAYYTPKPVVQFMCQQSLLLYLQTHLGEQPGLEELVRQKDPGENTKENWIRENAARIEELLDKVTICDPAIGSGAFPMGMLHEIFWIKLSLDWTLNDPKKFAVIKRRIIENTIHGVDLDPGAVEIAKLRCWLAIVVDDIEPRPLPNLDFKIHCANSLVEYFRGEPVSFLSQKALGPQSENYIERLGAAKVALFESVKKQEKRAAKLDVYRSLIELGKIEFTWLRTHEGFSGSNERVFELNNVLDEFNSISRELTAVDKLTAKNQDLLLDKIEKWFNDSKNTTFAWKIHFAEIFARGGFDIIIANPPYISSQATKDKNLLTLNFSTYDQSGDIYICFYELAVLISNKNGLISFITSNQFFRADYGKKIREFLLKNTNIHDIVDVSTAPVFEAAAYPAITHFLKSQCDRKTIDVLSWEEISNPDFAQFSARSKSIEIKLSSNKINKERWLPISEDKVDFLHYLYSSFKPLASNSQYEIKRGVVTGRDKVFLINDEIKRSIVNSDILSKNIIKPILIGKELSRWTHEQISKYIIFTKRGINIEDYSAIKTWLCQYRTILEPGLPSGRKPGPYKWYEIQDSTAYAHLFDKPKIAWGNLARSPKFCWVAAGVYLNAPSPFIVGADFSLLAILNSPVVHFLVHYSAAVRSGGYREYKNVYIKRIPIPDISDKLKSKLTDFARTAVQGGPICEDEYLSLASEAYNLNKKQMNIISDFLQNWKNLTNG